MYALRSARVKSREMSRGRTSESSAWPSADMMTCSCGLGLSELDHSKRELVHTFPTSRRLAGRGGELLDVSLIAFQVL